MESYIASGPDTLGYPGEDILMLSNPTVVHHHHLHQSLHPALLYQNYHYEDMSAQRMRLSVPKMEMEDAPNTSPVHDPDNTQSGVHCAITPQKDSEGIDDYRRFSARSKRKTDFFGVDELEGGCLSTTRGGSGGQHHSAGRGNKGIRGKREQLLLKRIDGAASFNRNYNNRNEDGPSTPDNDTIPSGPPTPSPPTTIPNGNIITNGTLTNGTISDTTLTNGKGAAILTNGIVSTATNGPVSSLTNGTISTLTNGTVSSLTNGTVSTLTNGIVSTLTNGPVSSLTNGTISTLTNGTVSTLTDRPISDAILTNGTISTLTNGPVSSLTNGTISTLTNGPISDTNGTVSNLTNGPISNALTNGTLTGDTSDSASTSSSANEIYPVGKMVWGKLPGYDWWPGCVVSYSKEKKGRQEGEASASTSNSDSDDEKTTRAWIKWYGENQLSPVSMDKLFPFEEFKKQYNHFQMKGLYRKAVLGALKEAAHRCKMEFISSPSDKKPRWVAKEGTLKLTLIREVVTENFEEDDPFKRDPISGSNSNSMTLEVNPSSTNTPKPRGRKGRGKVEVCFTSLEKEMIDWALNDFSPMGPEGLALAPHEKMNIDVVPIGQDDSSDEAPPRKKSKVMLLQTKKKVQFDVVQQGDVQLAEICIGCGDLDVITCHPLFEGGMCKDCKDNFMTCAYMFDDDGSQMYCSICNGGDQVFMCDAENCAKVYCEPCIEKLCGRPEVERVRNSEKWLCYMCCSTHGGVGLLSKRENWDICIRELFMKDVEMEYELSCIFAPIAAEERRPLRVLGLFDGIGTGYFVLKELGFEVGKYVASEIDSDAINVSCIQHKDIMHVGDIRKITKKQIQQWGPFDLVFGGSPCNDLSIVNPARKGIFEGTGRLFFEFYRILTYAMPRHDESRPFFWLYENVVSMRPHDKQTICRFLECNPVVVDAKEISAAHRARYFWGNVPGMNRPTIPLPGDRLTLQNCLEENCSRVAQFTKLRTITTKMNSIKQGKKCAYPVRVNGQDEGDVLWCTEMERLFGFPDHYTDYCNLGRSGRQRLLGKAWSVPVIRHLLSPLKDYFQSSTTKEEPRELTD